jgi:hypothetical protein
MNPPLRALDDRSALLDALRDGRIQCLASDHAPHTIGEKAASRMPECPAGVPGVQTMIPLMLAAGLPPARVQEGSTAAASIFRLPGKGALAPGFDADFAAYDLDASRPVRAEEMASRAGWTPFEGMPAIFPTDVFVRGRAVVAGGILAEAERDGGGRLVSPPVAPAEDPPRKRLGSSAIASVGYDAATRALDVEYRSEARVYRYYGVPAETHDAILRAPSAGAFVNERVKGRYGYVQRVEPDERA